MATCDEPELCHQLLQEWNLHSYNMCIFFTLLYILQKLYTFEQQDG
jgi:hypothetical protein